MAVILDWSSRSAVRMYGALHTGQTSSAFDNLLEEESCNKHLYCTVLCTGDVVTKCGAKTV